VELAYLAVIRRVVSTCWIEGYEAAYDLAPELPTAKRCPAVLFLGENLDACIQELETRDGGIPFWDRPGRSRLKRARALRSRIEDDRISSASPTGPRSDYLKRALFRSARCAADAYQDLVCAGLRAQCVYQDHAYALELYDAATEAARVVTWFDREDYEGWPSFSAPPRDSLWVSILTVGLDKDRHEARLDALRRAAANHQLPDSASLPNGEDTLHIPAQASRRVPVYWFINEGDPAYDVACRSVLDNALLADHWCLEPRTALALYALAERLLSLDGSPKRQTARHYVRARIAALTGANAEPETASTRAPAKPAQAVPLRSWLDPGHWVIFDAVYDEALLREVYYKDIDTAVELYRIARCLIDGFDGSTAIIVGADLDAKVRELR
jgi:hypothetical protein